MSIKTKIWDKVAVTLSSNKRLAATIILTPLVALGVMKASTAEAFASWIEAITTILVVF